MFNNSMIASDIKKIIIIKPSSGLIKINFKELWQYRELFLFFAWRNIVIRYKQTAIGIAWAGIQPIITMIIFTIIFGKLANLPSDGIPYPILVMAGVLPWQFFATSLQQASLSVVGNAGIVSKIYFPRLIVPLSSVISSIIDFCIAFLVFVVMLLWYQIIPSINIIFLPFFIVLAIVTSVSFSLWFSALNVAYRDIKHILPFLIRIGIYISPVGFLSTTVPDKYRIIYFLNPLVGIIDGFRWCVLGGKVNLAWDGLIISMVITSIILISGLYYFTKNEKKFADII